MRSSRSELQDLQGTVDYGRVGKAEFLATARLICLTSPCVNITDAILRLLAALFANGVGFVTTSNFHQMDFTQVFTSRSNTAAIMLKDRLQVLNALTMGQTIDGVRWKMPGFYLPLGDICDAEMSQTFNQLAETRRAIASFESHKFKQEQGGSVVWFDFKTFVW
jgi:cell division protein ZapE